MRRLLLPLLALLAVPACTHDPYDRDHYGYGPGPDYGGYYGDEWAGQGGDDLSRPDPWLEDTEEGRIILRRAIGEVWIPEAVRDLNIRFRRFADTDRDLRLTDRELRLALARCASHGWRW